MPRYYFHIRLGPNLLPDDRGMELADLDTARSEAEYGAREILAAKVKAGQVIDDEAIEIADEHGTVHHVLVIRSVLRLN